MSGPYNLNRPDWRRAMSGPGRTFPYNDDADIGRSGWLSAVPDTRAGRGCAESGHLRAGRGKRVLAQYLGKLLSLRSSRWIRAGLDGPSLFCRCRLEPSHTAGREANIYRIPPEIVAGFERHGFIWGGRWAHFDTMHFKYRPELLSYDPKSEE
jgi:hypothetical protein